MLWMEPPLVSENTQVKTIGSVPLRVFMVSCVSILLFAATGKIVHLFQESTILAFRDPIFPFLSVQQLIAVTAAIELLVLNVLLWNKDISLNLTIVTILGACFCIYRAMLYLELGSEGFQCPCLGAAGGWISRPLENAFVSAMACYLLIGSALFLYLRKRRLAPLG